MSCRCEGTSCCCCTPPNPGGGGFPWWLLALLAAAAALVGLAVADPEVNGFTAVLDVVFAVPLAGVGLLVVGVLLRVLITEWRFSAECRRDHARVLAEPPPATRAPLALPPGRPRAIEAAAPDTDGAAADLRGSPKIHGFVIDVEPVPVLDEGATR